ncbi:hypothetical protein [Pararhodobacter zhoushanensis]|uniref:Uncharacterized protein n=1 Tax=Pararhodobacter zhoushanensis TaxID=2479545 RepID=A0ABT3GUD6_9RHOB|nr:hypothetical protein [Pararhodobacter zhoushanensis]MCW1931145.1 hypothetical protein [Pararhodobacter zhoushanensis]
MTHRTFPTAAWVGILPRRLTLVVAVAALVLGGMTAGARPAKADADDILRFLAGALVVGAIVHAIDDNSTPHYAGRWALPGACLETIRVNRRNIDAYNARCLQRAGYQNLPYRCQYEFRVGNGRTRTGYIAECMYEAGFGRDQGGYSPPDRYPPQFSPPQYHPPYGRPPVHGRPPNMSPPRAEPPTSWLPGHCEMTYRQGGRRIDGYWGRCLRESGVRNLPGQCRVTSTDGDRIFNAQCLRNAGFRRGR